MAKVLLFCVALVTASCVVADEIDFQDKVNYPPQFVSSEPANDVINYTQDGVLTEFNVSIWDPDKDDFTLYDGRISLIEQLSSSVQIVDTFSCNEPVLGESDVYEGGALISVTCTLTMRATDAAAQNLIVLVELSDRGYGAGNVTPEDARTIQVMWTYEMLPPDAF